MSGTDRCNIFILICILVIFTTFYIMSVIQQRKNKKIATYEAKMDKKRIEKFEKMLRCING